MLQELSNLDNFLEWCFGSVEAVRIYKLTAMLHYRENVVLKNALQQGNLKFVNQFFQWTFDDAKKVRRVRSTLSR